MGGAGSKSSVPILASGAKDPSGDKGAAKVLTASSPGDSTSLSLSTLSSPEIGPKVALVTAIDAKTSPSFGLSLAPSSGGDLLSSLTVLSISSQYADEARFVAVERQKVDVVETVSDPVVVLANQAPIAGSGISRTTNEDKADFTIDLLTEGGVTDPNGDPLTVTNFAVTSGNQSAISLSGNNLSVSPSTFNSLNLGSSETVAFMM